MEKIKNNEKLMTLIKLIGLLLVASSFVGFKYYKSLYEKTPGESWLLNGENNDLQLKNVNYVNSVDYTNQFLAGGKLIIKNEKFLMEAEEFKLEICFEYNQECRIYKSYKKEDFKIKDDKIEIEFIPDFKEGFTRTPITNKFKKREEYEKKIKSMYFKIVALYNNCEEEKILNIDKSFNMNIRSSHYLLK